MTNSKVVYNISAGCSNIGGTIAIVISWSLNHSIWWCILHGVFGWFYVIYYALGGGR